MALWLQALLTLAILLSGWIIIRKARHRYYLPPGPKGLFLLGHMLQIPYERPWPKLREWARIYGDVLYLEALGTRAVILSSTVALKELLERRSANYSDRPPLTMLGVLCGFDRNFVVMKYDAEMKAHRKVVAPLLTGASLDQYAYIQREEAVSLALDCIRDSSKLKDHVTFRNARLISKITYGYIMQSPQDPVFHLILKTMHSFMSVSSRGAYPVDLVPLLRYLPSWFPGGAFRREADVARAATNKATETLFKQCSAGMAAGDTLAKRSVCGMRLANLGLASPTADAEKINWATFTAFSGGMDPNMSAVLSFIRMMIRHPEVQVRAQEEIDAVCRGERLPSIHDREMLPYVSGLVAEVFRLCPPAPLGIPHCATKDDVYEGMLIPKGSLVVGHICYLLRDETVYPRPDDFMPERYEGSDDLMNSVYNLVFGFGRRVCVGANLAQRSLFTFASVLLATCHILPVKDSSGRDVIPGMGFTSGAIVYPEPFNCHIKARSERALELLKLSGEVDTTLEPCIL